MSINKGQAGSGAQGGQKQPAYPAGRPPLRRTEYFDRSFKALGVPDQRYLLAKLQRFEQEWLDPNVSLADLKRTWRIKPVHDTEACRRLDVRQIRPGKDLRVLFTIVAEAEFAPYLEANNKTGKAAQSNDISRACKRAADLRHGLARR